MNRTTASLNAGARHSDKLSTRFGMQFVRTTIDGAGAQGASDVNILGFTQFVRTVDFNEFKPWIDPLTGDQINQINSQNNNPFWIRNENKFLRDDERFIGNAQLEYEPVENLTFNGIVGLDIDTDEIFRSNRSGTIGVGTGDFRNNVIQRRQLDVNARVNYQGEINEDIGFTIRTGFQYLTNTFERDENFGDQLAVVNLFSPGNAETNFPNNDFNRRDLYGIYGEAEFTYQTWLTLNVTGRNDWSSTLPLENNSFFYPSVSTSFIFSDAFNIASDFFSYGKIRASWAQVGGDTNPYIANFRFFPVANVF
ncbi:MAG: TonB-dependent receptor, partial [Bacteroidota bacterium]